MSPVVQKIALIFALVFAAAFLSAQEEDQAAYDYAAAEEEQAAYAESGEAESSDEELDLYYFNVPIVRIYAHPRGYYVLYRTSSNKVGRMCIPTEWTSAEDQRAVYNTVRVGVSPYVSYVVNNGEFYQVRINASSDVRDITWGVIGRDRVPDESFDVESVTLHF